MIRLLKEHEIEELQTGTNPDLIYPTVANQGDGTFEISEEAIGNIEWVDALSRPGRKVF